MARWAKHAQISGGRPPPRSEGSPDAWSRSPSYRRQYPPRPRGAPAPTPEDACRHDCAGRTPIHRIGRALDARWGRRPSPWRVRPAEMERPHSFGRRPRWSEDRVGATPVSDQPGPCAMWRGTACATPTALELHERVAYDAWLRSAVRSRGCRTRRRGGSAIGSLRRAATAALPGGLDRTRSTIRRCATTPGSRDAFAMSRRRDTLSFSITPRSRPFGGRAGPLACAERRAGAATSCAVGSPPRAALGAGGRPVVVRLQVAPEREQRWREAADASRLGDWLAAAADAAAHSVLEEPPQGAASRGTERAHARTARSRFQRGARLG